MNDAWQTFRLGDIAEIYDGPHATPKKTETGAWFLSISSLRNGRLALEESAHLSEEDFRRWTRRVTPQSGDVLFSYETRLGEAALMPNGVQACLGRRMGILRAKSHEVHSRFLLYAYLSPAFQAEIEKRAIRGATVDRIPLNELGSWPMLLPPLPEQRAITEILGAIDDKIDSNARVQVSGDFMLKTLFHQLAAPGIANIAEDQPLPEGWQRERLSSVLRLLETGSRPRGGVSSYSTGVPSLGAESILGIARYDYSKTKYVPIEYFHAMKRGVVQDGDVLLYKDGGRPGEFEPHVSLLGNGFPFPSFCINEHVYRLRAAEPLSQEFLFYWLASEPILEEMRRRGTGVAIPGLNSSSVRDLPINIPPPSVIEEFSAVARPVVARLLSAGRESRTLSLLRELLLPKLLSGEITVRDVEAIVEDAV